MAVIGERVAGAPAAAPAATTAPIVSDSDSDSDHECPEKEPEFVIDIVDSLSQPLIPRPARRPRLTMKPPALAAMSFPQPRHFTPLNLPQLQQLEYADMPKECTNCFICKIVHCVLMLVCVGVMLLMVRRLPEEYKEGNGALLFLCPIAIALLALHWLMLAKYDKEQC